MPKRNLNKDNTIKNDVYISKGVSIDIVNGIGQTLNSINEKLDKLNLPRFRRVELDYKYRYNGTMGDGVLGVLAKIRDSIDVNWKPGDDLAKRGWSASTIKKEGVMPQTVTMWHETGHHIHQQYGVKTYEDLKAPIIEKEVKEMFNKKIKIRNENMRKKIEDKINIFPIKYSEDSHLEWFAENFALFMTGSADICDKELLEYMKKKGII